jgi:hypothetical protein
MKVCFLTIVLDGMPWIASHFWEWRKLSCSWEWRIAEGVAAPVNCTSWVNPMAPRLSNDGTTEFLDSISALDNRVILFRKSLWPGKASMLNAMLKSIDEPCLLVEVDSDEIWRADQIERLVEMFGKHPEKNAGYFYCNYRLGGDIVATPRGEFGNRFAFEWHRAWRVSPGVRFATHEPPALENFKENPFTHEETAALGLVFEHYALGTEAQVKFKCDYYGSKNNALGEKYRNGVEGWKKLQRNTAWPIRLDEFLPWVGPKAFADKI